ncbi:MAG TPA: hypothetical protein VGN16_19365 [Acidobacteriaceae bacterium]|jgi:hypothetical protein
MRRCVLFGLLMLGAVSITAAQDPIKTLPKNYWVEFENPWIQVIHARYRPHEKVPVHDHSTAPTLYVYLSDSGPVEFKHGGAESFNLTRPALKAGQMRVSPGRIETHQVENLGDLQSDFLRVELKTLPIGLRNFNKRIPAADAAFWQEAHPEKVEFESPRMRVTRFGVAAGQHAALRGEKTQTAWIVVTAEGATIAGQAAHAGQTWASPTLDVTGGTKNVELVRIEVN